MGKKVVNICGKTNNLELCLNLTVDDKIKDGKYKTLFTPIVEGLAINLSSLLHLSNEEAEIRLKIIYKNLSMATNEIKEIEKSKGKK